MKHGFKRRKLKAQVRHKLSIFLFRRSSIIKKGDHNSFHGKEKVKSYEEELMGLKKELLHVRQERHLKKSRFYFFKIQRKIDQFNKVYEHEFPVERMVRVLGVS